MSKIVYLVIVVYTQFTAIRNESGRLEVKAYAKTQEHSFYSRFDAIDMKQKFDAEAPFMRYVSVTLDSVYICKADTQKTKKP